VNRPQARALLQEVDAIAARIRSEPVEQGLFDACAGLCAGLGEWHAAPAGSAPCRNRPCSPASSATPTTKPSCSPLVQQARDALGDEPFASAEHDGRLLRTAGTRDELRAWLAAGVLSPIPC
jgi:hypothetical protein